MNIQPHRHTARQEARPTVSNVSPVLKTRLMTSISALKEKIADNPSRVNKNIINNCVQDTVATMAERDGFSESEKKQTHEATTFIMENWKGFVPQPIMRRHQLALLGKGYSPKAINAAGKAVRTAEAFIEKNVETNAAKTLPSLKQG